MAELPIPSAGTEPHGRTLPGARLLTLALMLGAVLAVGVALVRVVDAGAALREAEFVSAGDALRTAIAVYWQRTAQAGAPHLPTSLTELDRRDVPLDPWTGRADWGTVQRADGGIVAVYSRSLHALQDSGPLAGVAELRPALSAEDRRRLGVSAWMFAWQPPEPAARPEAQAGPLASAIEVLPGRGLPPAAPARPEAALPRGRLTLDSAAVADARSGVPVVPPSAVIRPPVLPFNPFVAARPLFAEPAEAAGRLALLAPVESTERVATYSRAEHAREQEEKDKEEDPEPPEYVFSSDPRVRRCEMGLGIAQAVKLTCREAYSARKQDAGIAWDDCMRNLELSVAQCASTR